MFFSDLSLRGFPWTIPVAVVPWGLEVSYNTLTPPSLVPDLTGISARISRNLPGGLGVRYTVTTAAIFPWQRLTAVTGSVTRASQQNTWSPFSASSEGLSVHQPETKEKRERIVVEAGFEPTTSRS